MGDMTYQKGQRVIVTRTVGEEETTHKGTVDAHRSGWVMVDLDDDVESSAGWTTKRMMCRESTVELLDA